MIGKKWLLGFCCLAWSIHLWAYDQPQVNLGYTSFLDGGPPAGPGLYFQDYFQSYRTTRFNDDNGSRIPLPRTDADVLVNITQLIYLSKTKILGASLGISALLPWAVNTRIDDGLNHMVLQGQEGPGDLFIGPALQYDPIMRKDGKGPLYVQRLEIDAVVPIGDFNPDYAINPSSNYWSINPYWAATLWHTPKLSTSWRLHYLWNAKNHHPYTSFGPNIKNTQAGDAFFGNIATAYQLFETFFIGVNGYFFNQINETRFNGFHVPGREEKVWAIGPGAMYMVNKNNFLFLNIYQEQDARNRPQATNVILRYALHMS